MLNKQMLYLSVIIVISVFSCESQGKPAELTLFKFNGKEIAFTSSDYKIHNGTIYLTTEMLEIHMQLETKELVPGKQIGMCTEDLCIPFSLDKSDKTAAFKENESLFVPVETLMEQLSSKAKWDPEKRTLEMTYYSPDIR